MHQCGGETRDAKSRTCINVEGMHQHGWDRAEACPTCCGAIAAVWEEGCEMWLAALYMHAGLKRRLQNGHVPVCSAWFRTRPPNESPARPAHITPASFEADAVVWDAASMRLLHPAPTPPHNHTCILRARPMPSCGMSPSPPISLLVSTITTRFWSSSLRLRETCVGRKSVGKSVRDGKWARVRSREGKEKSVGERQGWDEAVVTWVAELVTDATYRQRPPSGSRVQPDFVYVEKAISALTSLFCDTKKAFLSFFKGGKFLTTSHIAAFAEEKALGCQPGDSRGRFHARPSLTKLKLSPQTLHYATMSAGRHIRPHGISTYAPGLRIPCSMGYRRIASRGTVRRQLGWARGHTLSGAARPVGTALGSWALLRGGVASRIV
eukprot:359427-Chlamydomonas_euryale.AAC.2